MSTNDPAFPPPHYAKYNGISRRDYFAAAAVQGMLAANNPYSGDFHTLCRLAYNLADQMVLTGDKNNERE